jgi:hypothetical protein
VSGSRPGQACPGNAAPSLLEVSWKLRFEFMNRGRLVFLKEIAGGSEVRRLLAGDLLARCTRTIAALARRRETAFPAGIVDRGDFNRRQRYWPWKTERQDCLEPRNAADRSAVRRGFWHPKPRSAMLVQALEIGRNRRESEGRVERESRVGCCHVADRSRQAENEGPEIQGVSDRVQQDWLAAIALHRFKDDVGRCAAAGERVGPRSYSGATHDVRARGRRRWRAAGSEITSTGSGGGEASCALGMERRALARTPVVAETAPEGVLSAHLRRPRTKRRSVRLALVRTTMHWRYTTPCVLP